MATALGDHGVSRWRSTRRVASPCRPARVGEATRIARPPQRASSRHAASVHTLTNVLTPSYTRSEALRIRASPPSLLHRRGSPWTEHRDRTPRRAAAGLRATPTWPRGSGASSRAKCSSTRLARPLLDRRLDLPDRAGRRGRAARRRTDAQRALADRGATRASRSCRAAPARRSAARRWAPRWCIDDTQVPARASLELDAERRDRGVQPGIVLDQLNARLRPHGLWYPVDVSTSAQATLGGMAGEQQLRRALACATATWCTTCSRHRRDGSRRRRAARFGASGARGASARVRALAGTRLRDARARARARTRSRARVPKVLRRVARLQPRHWPRRRRAQPGAPARRLARARSASSASSSSSSRRCPRHKALGICHFPTLLQAMELDAAHREARAGRGRAGRPHDDRAGARQIPAFRAGVERYVRGEPDAILLVEFAGDERAAPARASSGGSSSSWATSGCPGSVVEVAGPGAAARRLGGPQGGAQHHDVDEGRRKARVVHRGLRGAARAPRRVHGAAHRACSRSTARAARGTRTRRSAACTSGRCSTCERDGARKMRAIAEEACALVREYKGAYSGEHGDGLVRSEWIDADLRRRGSSRAFGEIKRAFDPKGLHEPGQDRARRRRWTTARCSASSRATRTLAARDRARLVGTSRGRGRGFAARSRCATTTAHCRKFDAGHHVPVVPRDARRAARDARPREHAAARAVRPARRRTRSPPTRVDDALDLCVSARAASASARPASTWRA